MRHWRGSFPPPVKDTESKIIEDRQIGRSRCFGFVTSNMRMRSKEARTLI
ncbi:unnamed protein product [Prunus armeniaca]|uniref:Uncharacterized protein n=1 Tax=Prunus armeniaca TaxID=36596 RepID=A0A6J5XVQ4_PRUAR|nr:unnamed protein product [Prunus armeniaca]CAB4315915.1 unnamed protein product [Prunus armeniaca]